MTSPHSTMQSGLEKGKTLKDINCLTDKYSMKNIVAIIGSASSDSSNLKLVQYLQIQSKHFFHITIYDQLKELPHFSPELSIENTPPAIIAFRQLIENADGVLISTPEYIFSIPSGLKNILEWSVSTTIFSKNHWRY